MVACHLDVGIENEGQCVCIAENCSLSPWTAYLEGDSALFVVYMHWCQWSRCKK